MKLTFVSPRYGLDIVGGAEYAVRQLAENCFKYGGVEAEVLTTTAGDERTWSSKYAEGTEVINNVKVSRFRNDAIDRDQFDQWASTLLANPQSVSTEQFDDWLKKQGPYSEGLLDAIEQCKSDAIIFHPMLSSPTSHGIFRAKRPTILHPALHDEPLARMPGYGEVLRQSSALAFSTRFEQQLGKKLHGLEDKKQFVLGFGIENPSQYSQDEISKVLEHFDLADKKYILVLGRVDPAKGSDLVAKYWEYAKNFVDIDKLVFVGPVSHSSYLSKLTPKEKQESSLVVTGALDEKDKDILLSQANILVSPSVTESFSLVLLEAMLAGVPCIVNRHCGPTYEHVIRSGAGSYFDSISAFISSIQLFDGESGFRIETIVNGKKYASENYGWEVLVNKYLTAVEEAIK